MRPRTSSLTFSGATWALYSFDVNATRSTGSYTTMRSGQRGVGVHSTRSAWPGATSTSASPNTVVFFTRSSRPAPSPGGPRGFWEG
jgi:hypothetical protein